MKCLVQSKLWGMVTFLLLPWSGGIWAQDDGSIVGTPQIVINGKAQAIPNPKDKLTIALLAANSSVARAIGIDEKTRLELRKMIHLNQGNLYGVIRYKNHEPSGEEVMARFAEMRLATERALDELISPLQWERLRQIAFQIEVARIGLGSALTDGVLSQEVGVYENQKHSLLQKAAEVDERTSAAIIKLLSEAQQEILRELTREQREKAERALGEPFRFLHDVLNRPISERLAAKH